MLTVHFIVLYAKEFGSYLPRSVFSAERMPENLDIFLHCMQKLEKYIPKVLRTVQL